MRTGRVEDGLLYYRDVTCAIELRYYVLVITSLDSSEKKTQMIRYILKSPYLALTTISLGLALSALVLPRPAGGQQVASVVQTTANDISHYVAQFKDISADVRVTQSDTKELAKIGSDFSASYSLRNMALQFKLPDKLRLEGKSATRGSAVMVINGPVRFVEVPRFKIHLVENLEKSPVRRQSLLELSGVLAPDTLKFMTGKCLRQEALDGHNADVFELKYTVGGSGQHYQVWMDRENKTTLRRDWLDADGKLKATFLYDQPKEASAGVWVPTRIQVKNGEGVIAAVINLDSIKINSGLEDTLFQVPG
jgi:outer membrane lipoprotein-sorting protein